MESGEQGYWSRVARRRYQRRTLLAGIAAGVPALALFGCGGRATSGAKPAQSAGPAVKGNSVAALVGSTGSPPPASEQPVRGGTYVHVQGGNMQGLDPSNTSATATIVPMSAVYSRPLRFKTDWDVNRANNKLIAPDIATSAESPDAITWTLKLRTNAKFHNIAPVNGRVVDADDIVASYQRALKQAVTAGGLAMMDASQIQAPDKSTVVIKLKYPFANFKNILASGQYSWIFPKEVASGAYDPQKVPIGSGPFTFDGYTPDVSINFKRNPDYYDQPRPYVDAIQVAIVPDVNQQFAQFTSGKTDFLSSISQQNLPTYQRQNPNAQTITNWGPGDGQVYFKPEDPQSPFKDIRVRRAMSLALDRDALTKAAFDGKAIPNFYSPQSLGDWSLKMEQLPADTAQWYKFDLQQATQLIKAAGAENLNIKYLSPYPYPSSGDSPFFHVTREATASMLAKLPWTLNLVQIDSTREWINGGKGVRYGNYDPTSAVWAGLEGHNDVDEYIFAWYDSQSPSDIEQLKDAQLESMIQKGRSIINDDERLKYYIQIQQYMAAQLFSIAGNPNGLSYTMVNPRVRNYMIGDSYGSMTSTVANVWLKK
jgi:peptide/nickel transport system substrate-binding protein